MTKCKTVKIGIENQIKSDVRSTDHNYGLTHGSSKRKAKTKPGLVENTQSHKRQCNNCGKLVTRKWIKHHRKISEKKQVTAGRHYISARIDSRQGIYCSSKKI